MGRRLVLAMCLLVALALSGEPPKLTFIHPKSAVIMAGFSGADIPVQTRITPDARARIWSLAWDGDNCGGSSMRSLDGAESAVIQPEDRPLTIRVGPPSCVLVARVLDTSGAVLESARYTLTVCGGTEDGCSR